MLIFFTGVLSVNSVYATKIYKWVDDNGQVHYSEKKPANLKSNEMNVTKNSPSQSSEKESVKLEPCKTRACQLNKFLQENQPPKYKHYPTPDPHQQSKTTKEKYDAELIAKCKNNRDTYCDKGADEIRRIEEDKALMQQGLDRNARMHGPGRPVILNHR